MEQFPDVCLRRRGLGKSELSGMAAQDNVVRLAVPLIRNPRMSGAQYPEMFAFSSPEKPLISGNTYLPLPSKHE